MCSPNFENLLTRKQVLKITVCSYYFAAINASRYQRLFTQDFSKFEENTYRLNYQDNINNSFYKILSG